MSLKPFVAKINNLLENDYITAIQLIEVERLQLLKRLTLFNCNSHNGVNKIINILIKLKYLHIVNIQDISQEVMPKIIGIFESNYVKSLSRDQMKTLTDCLEIYIKYIKLYNGSHNSNNKILLNNVYTDLDYCKMINKLIKIFSDFQDLLGINVRINYYNLFLDHEYRFLQGSYLEKDIEKMMELNYHYLTAILDKVISKSIKLDDYEEELQTLNVILFSNNSSNIFNPFIELYLENNNDYIDLLNKIISSKKLTIQRFIILRNFVNSKNDKTVTNSILTNKIINFITELSSSSDISRDKLYLLLQIFNDKELIIPTNTSNFLLKKLETLLDQQKLSHTQKGLLKLTIQTMKANETGESIEQQNSLYKEPHFSQWSSKWDDLIQKKLVSEQKQDINFVKWVIQSTNIPISDVFLQTQYKLASSAEQYEWRKLMGQFDSEIDAYIYNKSGLISGFNETNNKGKNIQNENKILLLNNLIKKRLVIYDIGVLYECNFYKINYIINDTNLKIIIKDNEPLKTAEMFIDGCGEKINDLEYKFDKEIDTISKPCFIDIKLRTIDDRLFCQRIEFKLFLNKFFIETQEMTQDQFETFFNHLSNKFPENNEKIEIKSDFNTFIIFLKKLNKYKLKTISISNDLLYIYTMVSTDKNGKFGILSKIYFTESGDWEIDTISTYKDVTLSKLFNEMLSVS